MPGPASRGLTSMVVRRPGAWTIGGFEEKVRYPLDIRTVMGVPKIPFRKGEHRLRMVNVEQSLNLDYLVIHSPHTKP